MSEPAPPTSAPEEHDAWLRQALLHAPDASAAPPDALRRAILAEARSALRAAPPRAARSAWLDSLAAFWSWLARPPVAAGFASVMAATLVGMMWWDRPMDQATLAPPPSRVAAPTSEAPAGQPAAPAATAALAGPDVPVAAPPARSPEPPPRIVAAKRAAPPAAEATTAADATASAEANGANDAFEKRERSREVEDKKRQAQASLETLPARPAAAPFPTERTQDAAVTQGAGTAVDATRKAQRAVPPLSPPVAKDEPGTTTNSLARSETQRRVEAKPFAAANADAVGGSANTATAPRQRAATADSVADALEPRASLPAQGSAIAPPAAQGFAAAPPAALAAPQGRTAAPAPVSPERAAPVEAPVRPLAEPLGSLARDLQPWSRLDARGQTAPVDAATRSWLVGLDAVTAGFWQLQAERTSRLDGALADDAGSLSLRRDGRLALRVRLQERGVLVEAASGPAWFAPLPAATLARLRAALPPVDR